MNDVTSLNEFREARREPEITVGPIVEPQAGTVGDMITRMWSGEVPREQVIEALQQLDHIHWDVAVQQPGPKLAIVDSEMEL